jgi:hypothetical protein
MMPEDIENDPTDQGTNRPNAAPLKKAGSEFKPMNLPDFSFEITYLKTSLQTILSHYLLFIILLKSLIRLFIIRISIIEHHMT